MATASIRLLGQLSVQVDHEPLAAFPSRNAAFLFAYLVLHRDRWLDREVLAGTLWGDRTDDAARKTLRSGLWRIRCTLKDGGIEPDAWFDLEPRRLRFVGREEGVAVDVHAFETATRHGVGLPGPILPCEVVAELEEALSLYTGDLIPGCYEDWAFLERERLHLRRLAVLEALVRHYQATSAWRTSLRHAHTILRADPLREPAHRAVIRGYHELGDRPSAIRHYRRLERLLAEELEVEPMPESRALYQEVLANGSQGMGYPAPPSSPRPRRALVPELHLEG